jgi:predicted branched-subunit amino acid permease
MSDGQAQQLIALRSLPVAIFKHLVIHFARHLVGYFLHDDGLSVVIIAIFAPLINSSRRNRCLLCSSSASLLRRAVAVPFFRVIIVSASFFIIAVALKP